MQNVSKNKEVQEILRKSEEKHSTVVENSNDGIVIHKNGKIVFVNQVIIKELGYDKKEVLGRNLKDFIAPEFHDIILQQITNRRALKTKPELTQIELICKDASRLPVELNTSLIEYDDEDALLVFIRNISERIISENILKDSESKLKEAQKIAHIGHWHLDIINNKLEWSDEIFRIYGMDPAKFEPSYENFLSAIHPDDREFVNKSYADSLENKTRYNITHRIVLPKGEMRFVRERCKTIYSKSGRPIYSLGTVQDITEVALATKELLHSEKRFKQLFEDLGDAVFVTKIGGVNKGQILEVNSAAIKQTGYSRKELLNMNIINSTLLN